jgi:hypothetical protein
MNNWKDKRIKANNRKRVNNMVQLTPDHFELIDRNKAKAYEDRKEMRNELINFIEKCDTLQLSKLYDEYKRNKK